MVEITINVLKTRKFLCCVNLRAATLTLVWATFLLYVFIIFHLISNFIVNWPKSSLEATAHFFELGCTFMGAIPSIICLLHFPALNETYSPNSKNAKCIKLFAFYFGLLSVTFLAHYLARLIAASRENPHRRIDSIFAEGLIHFVIAGIFIHLTAVIYSFYLSVLADESIGNNDGGRNKNQITVDV